MSSSIIDTFFFAPFAPFMSAVLFWIFQLLVVESMKYGLSKIWNTHTAFCRFSNFLGILFQALAHAAGYTLTGIGVSEFSISVNDSKVSPKKEKEGFYAWFANAFLALGPFFIPPFMVFCILLASGSIHLNLSKDVTYTFAGMMLQFSSTLADLSYGFVKLVASLDLFNPFHLAFLIILIATGLGIRPSYIEGGAKKLSILHDLYMIKNLLVNHPKYLLIVLATFYLFFLVTYWLHIPLYATLFSVLAFLSIIAIISMFFVHFLILILYTSDKLHSYKRFVPIFVPLISYVPLRLVFVNFDFGLTLSLVLSLLITVVTCVLIIRGVTNKLKRLERLSRSKVRMDERR